MLILLTADLTAQEDESLRKPIRIACLQDYSPFTMRNSKGEPAGMFVDLWQRWAEKTGQKIEFRFSAWTETLTALKNGDADIHAGLFRDAERLQQLEFSQPFYEIESTVFYPAKYGDIFDLNDIEGKHIGVMEGSLQYDYLRRNFPQLTVVSYNSNVSIINAAVRDEIYAFMDEVPTVSSQLNRLGLTGAFKTMKAPRLTHKVFSAVRGGNRELLNLVDKGLNAFTYKELAEIGLISAGRWISDPHKLYFKNVSSRIRLTAAEEAWLKAHKSIRAGVGIAFPPFQYIGEDGTFQGMASDYIRIVNERLNLSIEAVPNLTWPQVLERAKERKIDVLACASPTPEREAYMNFSRPYLFFPIVIITRKNAPFIGSLEDLHGKKVAIVRELFPQETLKTDHPTIVPHIASSTLEALESVSLGKSDAYIGNLVAASWLIQKHGLANLKVAAPTAYNNVGLCFAVRKDWRELLSLINKGLDSVTQEEHDAIRQKWIPIRFEHGIDPAYIRTLAIEIGAGVTVILCLFLLWNVQIRRREERFRGLTEHGTDIIQAFTKIGKIVYQSPSHTKVLGYERDELLGKSALALFHESDLPRWENIFSALLKGEEVQTFVHRLKHKEGHYLYVESKCINLLNNRALRAIVINARDITERQIAEEKFRALFEYSPDAHLIYDDSGIIACNDAALGVLGCVRRDQIFGFHPSVLSPETQPDGASSVEKHLEMDGIARKQKHHRFEWIYRKMNGEEFPAEATLTPVTYAEKSALLAVWHDLTEHRRAEEFIRKNEERYRNLFNTALVGLYRVRSDGSEVLAANPAAARIFGYEADAENLEKFIQEFSSEDLPEDLRIPRNLASLISPLRRLIQKQGKVDGFEMRIKDREGNLKYISVSAVLYPDKEYIEGVIIDITERRKAGEEIRRLNEFREIIIDNANVMVSVLDKAGNFIVWNKAAERVSGYSREEVLGHNRLWEWIYPDVSYREKVRESYLAALKSGAETELQFMIRTRNGEYRTVAVYPRKMSDENGAPAGIINVAFDVTEEKRAVEELKKAKAYAEERSQAADIANRSKSEFLANMSHEIRTPMNAVIGMTELTLQTELTAEQKQHLQIVRDSARNLLGIINDILDFSKIEAGKITLENIDFDLEKMLKGVMRTFSFQAEKKGLYLILNQSDSLPRVMKGDPLRLRQILVNLVSNAFKFTERGGVTVNAECPVQRPSGQIVLSFSVTDTGIGIPENKHEKIFESFTQAEASVGRKYGGSGLGLAICRQLVTLMGGSMLVESRVGVGSTFSFSGVFEIGDEREIEDETSQNLSQAPIRSIEPANILLAEDNEINATVAQKFLEGLGHTVALAHNGKEAIQMLSESHFDLVLMDVEMPEMDGIEATRRIREGVRGQGSEVRGEAPNPGPVPIIAMTAHALNEFREKCEAAGMNDFVTKPLDFNELNTVIEKHAANRKPAVSSLCDLSEETPVMPSPTEDEGILNKDEALKRFGRNEMLLRKTYSIFTKGTPAMIEKLRESVHKNDFREVAFQSHEFKSTCGIIGAESCRKLAVRLEQAAKAAHSEQIPFLSEQLEKELHKVMEMLEVRSEN